MSWRTETMLRDLDPDTEFEVSCRMCGKHRYEWAGDLVKLGRLGGFYIDQVQRDLRCFDRKCDGPVRICVMHDKLEEGFVAGMP
ncbi:hypothetical protein [Asticcacaulis endophyticus]|uniref:Uncharacterized protein n=1 Tax=Asticcacaulis endophyticus TaxID=1395890 RepID=A0A918Q3P4_9CAUL|nr:hypothetical protein [Asticcacaulis endophyticus]GGZ31924.1 hypothetical protein GCM10011273_17420 [Asticcacaulis endophyticus]